MERLMVDRCHVSRSCHSATARSLLRPQPGARWRWSSGELTWCTITSSLLTVRCHRRYRITPLADLTATRIINTRNDMLTRHVHITPATPSVHHTCPLLITCVVRYVLLRTVVAQLQTARQATSTRTTASIQTSHHHHHHRRRRHSKPDKAPLTGAQRRRTDIK